MSKVKVLTEKEIENIKKVREDFQILVGNVGEVEVAIMNLNKKKKELESELLLIQEKERRNSCKFRKKIWQRKYLIGNRRVYSNRVVF
jgi:hypothetical protein